MYDHIKLKADLQSIGSEDFFTRAQTFPNAIPEIKEGVIEKVIFYEKNLRVTVWPERISIHGSICKYYHGTNQYTLTRKTTEAAFNQLAVKLQLPISKFNVVTFEFESNLIMDHKVKYYYDFLGKCKGIKNKWFIKSTVYYNNTYRRLSFYDKIKEINNSKREQVKVINVFKGMNVLRYGVRYHKTINKKFNRASTTVADLYSKEFYNEVVQRWRKEYFNIDKYKKISFANSSPINVKTRMDQYALMWIVANGGKEEALKMIDRDAENKVIKEGQKYRHIKAINELFDQPSLAKEDAGVLELNRKINEEAERHLNDDPL